MFTKERIKIFLFRAFIFFGILFLSEKSLAATTYDWTGNSSTAWNVAGNWKIGGSTATTYPGQSGTTDIVRIGTNVNFTRQPTLSTSNIKVASITFGINNNNDITLTVNTYTLTTTGDIIQNHGAGSSNSSTTYQTNLAGTGAIYCTGNFQIGNTTGPTSKAVNTTSVSSQITLLTIHGNMAFNGVGNNTSTATNYPNLNLDQGKIILDGQFTSSSLNGPNKQADPYAYGRFNAGTTTNAVTLELTNNQAISSTFTANYVVDFLYTGGNNGTVIYSSTSGTQTVYTTANASVGTNPQVYYNLTFSGASTKVADGSDLTVGNDWSSSGGTVNLSTNDPDVTVGGNWTNSATVNDGDGDMSIGGDAVNSGTINGGNGATTINGNLTSSNNIVQGFGNINVQGDLLNSGNLTEGAGSLTMWGNYTNTGNFTASTGNTVFAGMSEVLKDSGSGTMFNNVIFNGNGGSAKPITMNSGNFSVSSSGILTMVNNTYLNANNNLTLKSDATGSAAVAAIPLGAAITGTVKVQRFVKGSTDVSKRGYRLMSSPVYTTKVSIGTSTNVPVFDFEYLLPDVYVSGYKGTINNFNLNTASNNPTIYLFREDVVPPPSNSTLFYTQYNWKGVAKIGSALIGTQAKNTTTNINDASYYIPVGNGFLFFFRGAKVASVLTPPYSAPADKTLTQSGTLNTGTIDVKLWYAPDYPTLGNNFSFTNWASAGATSPLQGGYTLVGNPYASTINWEKYNRNSTKSKSSIYGGGTTAVSTTIWVFNVITKQFESYTQKTGTITSADTTTNINPGTTSVLINPVASNMIASGQGFFVVATAANQNLSFRETAKTSTQPTATKLNSLMGKPKDLAATPVSPSFHLQLVTDPINMDEIAIRISDQASTKFVVDEDAQDMGGSGAPESLSAFSSDSVALSISQVPYPGKTQEVIPLLVDVVSSGSYKLVNNQLANLPSLYEMWLKDSFTNDSLKMATNATYTFNIDKNDSKTFGSKRFSIIIRQSQDMAYKLLDFTATKVTTAHQVQLAWKTQNEQSNTNFTVERSTDNGKTFVVIGGLTSQDVGNYSMLDKNPIVGANLYRLKQEDFNNTITYSKTITIQYTDLSANINDRVRVYPNPAVSTINVAIASDVTTKPPYTIQITNSSGLLIKQVNSAHADWQSSINGLKPGTYIVKVHNSTDNSFIGDTKFVKL